MNDDVGIAEMNTVYVAGLSGYHLWTGAVSFFAPDFALRFYRAAYGCDPLERRHLKLILRPWGALAFFAGTAGFVALGVPDARGGLFAALATLLAMRIAYRAMLWRELRELSRIEPGRNLIGIAMLTGGLALLLAELAMNFIPS